MIVCERCGRKFRDADHLGRIIQYLAEDGKTKIVKASDFDFNSGTIFSVFYGCPDCLSDEFLKEAEVKEKKKYRKGSRIGSLDELMEQDFVYLRDKIQPKGWFCSWQIKMAYNLIQNGVLFKAEKADDGA